MVELVRRWAAGAVAAGSVLAAGPAWGQALVTAAGVNPTLQSVARNIVSICPRLPAATAGAGANSADVNDLYLRCSAAVTAANTGQTATAAAALGQIAPEELIAQDAVISGAVQPQTAALAGRIAALGGAGPGRQFASLSLPRMYAQGGTSTATDAAPADAGVSRVGRFDGFITGYYGVGEKDSTALEGGFDADSWSVLGGVDYGLSESLTLGAAVGYASIELDFANAGGSLETDSLTVAGYGTYTAANGLYSSATAAYSWVDYNSDRRISYTEPSLVGGGARPPQGVTPINRVAQGETEATQYELTGRLGYSISNGNINYGPSGGVSYRKLEIDGFAERGAQGLDMAYQDQDAESLLVSLGGDISWSVSTGGGILTPYVHGAYLYEAMDNKRTIDMFYRVDPFVGTAGSAPVIRVQTASPDRSRFELAGGVSAQFAGGFSGFVDLQTVLGQDDVTNYGLAFGLRREF